MGNKEIKEIQKGKDKLIVYLFLSNVIAFIILLFLFLNFNQFINEYNLEFSYRQHLQEEANNNPFISMPKDNKKYLNNKKYYDDFLLINVVLLSIFIIILLNNLYYLFLFYELYLENNKLYKE